MVAVQEDGPRRGPPSRQAEAETWVTSPDDDRQIRVLTVDDHRMFREALRDLIAAAPGLVLVGQACSGEESVRAVERLSPQLVLMDIAMPGMGGIAAARAILTRHPAVVVVLISVDDPALDPGARDLVSAAGCVRKQDLRPNQLRQLWEAFHHSGIRNPVSTEHD